MIRVILVAWFCLAALAAAVLFRTTYSARDLERQLGRLERAIADEHEAITILDAEWAYLNRPDRLEGLVRRLTDLAPLPGPRLASRGGLMAALETRPQPPMAAAAPVLAASATAPAVIPHPLPFTTEAVAQAAAPGLLAAQPVIRQAAAQIRQAEAGPAAGSSIGDLIARLEGAR